jgi:hypothetical protein
MDTKGQVQRQRRLKRDGLIESLRDLGGSTVKSLKDDFLTELPKDVFEQTGLRPQGKPDRFPPQETAYFEEREFLRRGLRQAEIIRHEEKLVFTSKERETTTQVAVLVEEAKKLANALQSLENQVEVATFQAPVEPGVYHVSFFQKLISFLRTLTAKIEDATHWAATCNTKAKKRSFYWGQVQKSGTKFMLSQERYMATQAG